VYRILKQFKEDDSIDRRPGFGRLVTVSTEENGDLVEDLICSQEDEPGSHFCPREI